MAVVEKLINKKTTAADLPEELVRREVLTRLPIKTVVRFKSVSKSWLSLFSNPQFVKQHLTYNFIQNPNEYDCLIANKRPRIVILSRYKETLALSYYPFTLVGSIRGLVCLRHISKFSLWNPAIHQSKEFTLPPSRCDDHFELLGFGFDPVSNNFKVVVVSLSLRSGSVYHSNSDSWIDVFVPDNVRLPERRTCSGNSMTIVKDCPYWTFEETDMHYTSTSLILVKFDAGSNELKLLPVFYFDTSEGGESCAYRAQFVDMKDCLTLMVFDLNSSKCMVDIYSLNGEEGCWVWSKMYSTGPLDFIKSHWFLSQGFYGGEIVFHDSGMFSCYDRKTSTIKRIRPTSTIFSYVSCCFRYTPSLVFLEGMKYVHLTTQTHGTTAHCTSIPRRLVNSLRNYSFA